MLKDNLSKTVELLAPAGNMQAFLAAVNAGADAVYMGLKTFNARVMTSNFEIDEYIYAIDYAHKRNVKVYLTLNTLLYDNEIEKALQDVITLYNVGLDGIIVQDLGFASVLRKALPDLPLHASTQMSVCTLEQVRFLEKFGFTRVVLARELSIDEIEYIVKNTKLEVEVFVHGALCVAVSGQCLMSALIGNRSANRGSCAGPCRKKYALCNTNGNVLVKEKYLLSKKDIFGLDKIEKLREIGVTSLKIEGRNKTEEYVAGVVESYRKVLNNGYDKHLDKDVLQLFNRSGKSAGYLGGVRYKDSISFNTAKNTGLVLGKVIDTKKGYVKVRLEQDINMHDGIEIIGGISTIVTCIRDEKFNLVNALVKAGSIVWLGDVDKAKVSDTLYKTSDNMLNEKFKKYSALNLRKVTENIKVVIKGNEEIYAVWNGAQIKIECIPEQSKNALLTEDKIRQAFAKTEDTSLIFDVSIDLDEELFVPTSKLNELRKKVVEYIENSKCIRRDAKLDKSILDIVIEDKVSKEKQTNKNLNSLYVYRFNKTKDYIKYYEEKYNEKLDNLYINAVDFFMYEKDVLKYINKCDVYFVIPNVTLKNESSYILSNLERLINEGVKGIVVGNIGYIEYCNVLKQKYGAILVADYSLNITNTYTANVLKENGIDRLTPLIELEDADITHISKILPIEFALDKITVMTTRYCVLASFVKNAKVNTDCKKECLKQDYYLLDEQNKRYDIITNPLDCVSRLVRNNRRLDDKYLKIGSKRHCI